MIPAVYAVAAIVIGVVLPRLEHRSALDFSSRISSASAIAIYSAVGTGTMTLSAIVFSLTFVMVQFSAISGDATDECAAERTDSRAPRRTASGIGEMAAANRKLD